MKKLIALILAIVMILSLSISASALELGEYIYLRVDIEGVEKLTAAVMSFEGVDGGLHLTKNDRGLYANTYYDESLASAFTLTVEYYDENGEVVRLVSDPMYLDEIDGIIVLDENGFHVENSYLVQSTEYRNTKTIPVSGEFAGDQEQEQVISADLSWGAMEFVYTPHVEWNPETHTYEPVEGEEPIWELAPDTSAMILLMNHSNVPLSVGLEFNGNDKLNIEGEFYVTYDTGREEVITGFLVASAEGSSVENPPLGWGHLRITGGEIPEDAAPAEMIGVVTVTISPVDIEA